LADGHSDSTCYSTFLRWDRTHYRTDVGRKWGFNLDLSYVARCEDDDFSYQFFKAGYDLYVVPEAVYWHLPALYYGKLDKKSPEYIKMCKKDRAIFEARVRKWNNWKPGETK